MKAKFTYKEFSLMAGIIVAVIIALTLWMRPVSTSPESVSRKLIPSVTKPAVKATVEKIILMVFSIA